MDTNLAEDLNTEQADKKEIIEVEWEQVKDIYEMRGNLAALQQNLANMCLDFEKTKYLYLDQISKIETAVNEQGANLLEENDGDVTKTYELKMPTSPGEKAYFILK
jgi:hypothetical protein